MLAPPLSCLRDSKPWRLSGEAAGGGGGVICSIPVAAAAAMLLSPGLDVGPCPVLHVD